MPPEVERDGPGRPPNSPDGAADAQIQLRCTRKRKGAYVRAARATNTTLAAWMFKVCDEAAGFKE